MGRRRGKTKGRQAREARARKRLESYRTFIEDWDAFQDAIHRQEPTTLRTNTVRVDREELADRLRRQGFGVEPVPHQPAFLKVTDQPFAVSDTLEHWAGLFYMQQSATGWAAPLLAPEPGERVLDLCSAPGGKTTHLAELMEGRGSVVCADVNEGRIRALLGNIYRLGHTNIMTLAGDGRHFPLGATFDRIMVDVPCSAEGTLRKRGGILPGQSRKWVKQVTKAQEKLLRRAVALTRPGGCLLYVTCTFGPEENEAVLTRVLADTPLEVDGLELPVDHAPGLTSHDGERFDPRLRGAVRLYPHHLDSGGLFLCRLIRPAEVGETAGTVGWTPVPADFPVDEDQAAADPHAPAPPDADAPTPGEELDAAVAFLGDGLGVAPEALDDLRWMRRGSNLWAHTLDGWPVEAWEASPHWRTVAVGFRALDLGGGGPPRPTNDLLAWLDDRITAGRVDLEAAEWVRLLHDREVAVSELSLSADASDAAASSGAAGSSDPSRAPDETDTPDGQPVPDGIVALCQAGTVLGRGFQRGGVLRHEIPKGRLNWLRNLMEIRARGAAGPDASGLD